MRDELEEIYARHKNYFKVVDMIHQSQKDNHKESVQLVNAKCQYGLGFKLLYLDSAKKWEWVEQILADNADIIKEYKRTKTTISFDVLEEV